MEEDDLSDFYEEVDISMLQRKERRLVTGLKSLRAGLMWTIWKIKRRVEVWRLER